MLPMARRTIHDADQTRALARLKRLGDRKRRLTAELDAVRGEIHDAITDAPAGGGVSFYAVAEALGATEPNVHRQYALEQRRRDSAAA